MEILLSMKVIPSDSKTIPFYNFVHLAERWIKAYPAELLEHWSENL